MKLMFFVLILNFISSGQTLFAEEAKKCTTTEDDSAYNPDPVTETDCPDYRRIKYNPKTLLTNIMALPNLKDVIPCLPEEYRRNFTLIYDSSSPHSPCGGPNNPRIVMFSNDGKSVISLPGNKEGTEILPACNKVEVLEFDENNGGYRPSSLAFAPEKKMKINDTECTYCHQRPGGLVQLNWEQYPLWPGTYGSVDDAIETKSPIERAKPINPEGQMYQQFLNGNKNKIPYKYLQFPKTSAKPPYLANDDDLPVKQELRPNFKLSRQGIQLSTQSMVIQMSKKDNFNQLKYQTLGKILACPQFVDKMKCSPKYQETKKIIQEKAQKEINSRLCRKFFQDFPEKLDGKSVKNGTTGITESNCETELDKIGCLPNDIQKYYGVKQSTCIDLNESWIDELTTMQMILSDYGLNLENFSMYTGNSISSLYMFELTRTSFIQALYKKMLPDGDQFDFKDAKATNCLDSFYLYKSYKKMNLEPSIKCFYGKDSCDSIKSDPKEIGNLCNNLKKKDDEVNPIAKLSLKENGSCKTAEKKIKDGHKPKEKSDYFTNPSIPGKSKKE